MASKKHLYAVMHSLLQVAPVTKLVICIGIVMFDDGIPALLAAEVSQQLSAACQCFWWLQRVRLSSNVLKQHMTSPLYRWGGALVRSVGE